MNTWLGKQTLFSLRLVWNTAFLGKSIFLKKIAKYLNKDKLVESFSTSPEKDGDFTFL